MGHRSLKRAVPFITLLQKPEGLARNVLLYELKGFLGAAALGISGL